jgi:hypothetical protein
MGQIETLLRFFGMILLRFFGMILVEKLQKSLVLFKVQRKDL